MDSVKTILDALDKLPFIAKLIIALPCLDIIWALYRICRSFLAKNNTNLIINIVLLFIPFMWVIDLIMVAFKGQIWSLD
jgi:hypothetical protein